MKGDEFVRNYRATFPDDSLSTLHDTTNDAELERLISNFGTSTGEDGSPAAPTVSGQPLPRLR